MEKSLLMLLQEENKCVKNYNMALEEIQDWEEEIENEMLFHSMGKPDSDAIISSYKRCKIISEKKAVEAYNKLKAVREEMQTYFQNKPA